MDLSSMLAIETYKLLLGPALSFHFRLKSEGVENVPEAGPVVLVCNHRCYADPLILSYVAPRYINFAAGSHLYGVPGTAPIFKLAGFFRMNIYGGKEGDESLDEASKLLSDDEVIGIFPEGIESFMDIHNVSKISTFKTGFAKVALENKAPIVPAALFAREEKEFPRVPGPLITPFVTHPRAKDGIVLITYRDVTCRIGRPIDLSPFYEEVFSKNLIDKIAGKIRRIVIKLYDGEDLDKYLTGETPFDFANDRV